VDRLAEGIPYRSYLNRDRLIYLTHPDPAVRRALGDEFIAQGFEVSLLPDLPGLSLLMARRRPDLVLMGLCDAEGSNAEALAALDAIRGQHLGIHAFLLAPAGVRAEQVVQAMKHGASSVFSPPYAPLEIAEAMQDVFRAELRLAPGKDGTTAVTLTGFGTLTHRERQILQHVVEGRTNKEIAMQLGLSYRTVEVHRRHIMVKTGARNTADLVRLAIES